MNSVADSNKRLKDAVSQLRVDPDEGSAWRILYEELQPMFAVLARKAFGDDSASVAEAIQNTFVQLYTSHAAQAVNDISQFRGYAATTCRNCVSSMLRSSGRRNRAEVGLEALDPWSASRDSSREGQSISDPEAIEIALDTLLSGLGTEDKALLRLILDGIDYKQIAKRLRIRESAAAVRITRLKIKIRKLLHDNTLR